jgi:hypothetical protein
VHLKLSPKKLKIIRKAVKAYGSPTQSGSDDGEVTINELVADTHNPTPDVEVEDNDQLRRSRNCSRRSTSAARRSSSSATAWRARTR